VGGAHRLVSACPYRSRREGNRLVVDVDTFLTTLYVMVDDFC
jgi:hypothetical protein